MGRKSRAKRTVRVLERKRRMEALLDDEDVPGTGPASWDDVAQGAAATLWVFFALVILFVVSAFPETPGERLRFNLAAAALLLTGGFHIHAHVTKRRRHARLASYLIMALLIASSLFLR